MTQAERECAAEYLLASWRSCSSVTIKSTVAVEQVTMSRWDDMSGFHAVLTDDEAMWIQRGSTPQPHKMYFPNMRWLASQPEAGA